LKSVVILLACIFLQNAAICQDYLISGKVVDENNTAVPFASLSIIKPGDTTRSPAEKITDEAGMFKLLVGARGSYELTLTHSSFGTITRTILVTDTTNVIKIVMVKNAKILNTVTVTAKRPLITRKVDRIVMNVSNNPGSAGKSSLQLFQSAPGVFVNNGNISINGIWGTRVMVNGRMLDLGGNDLKNYLQNLKANEIQSIEIIAHPPAEYDAEGTGGIINIILKKNTKTGLNGYAGADYSIGLGKYPSYNPYLNLNYKVKKISLFANYSFNHEKGYLNIDQYRNFLNNGNYSSNTQSDHTRISNNIRIGASFEISSKQYLDIFYNGQFTSNTDSTHSASKILYPVNQQNIYSAGSFPIVSQANYSDLGLSYDLKTDTLGSKLKLTAGYIYNHKDANSATNSQTYDFKNDLLNDTIYKFSYPSISNILTVDLSYNKIFKPALNLSFGAKVTGTDIKNTNNYDIYFLGAWTEKPELDFKFNYRENVLASFVNLSGTYKKTDYKIGLRGENTHLTGDLTGAQKTSLSNTYSNLFPSLFLKRNLDKDGADFITFSYNKRIKRPSYFDLNPYKYFIDNYTVQTGNANLAPQYTNAFELGFNWKGKYYLSLGYAKTTNLIGSVIISNPLDSVLTVTKLNTGNNTVYSTNISIPIDITKWWNSSNNLQGSFTKSIDKHFNIEKFSYLLQSENQFNLPHGLSLNLTAFYTPRIVTGNIVTGRIASVDWGIQKKFWKNKWLAKASVSDIFYTNNFHATSYYNGTEIHISQKEQTRILSISLQYNFNFGKAFTTKNIERANAEEKSRLQ